ncbi:MAG: hypothetical protein ACMXYE_00005 [Candidatus Woesearchaeota archaeon]
MDNQRKINKKSVNKERTLVKMNTKSSITAFIYAILFFLLIALSSSMVLAQQPPNVYFFWGDGCPHCSAQKPFLEELKSEFPSIQIYDFEVWGNQSNRPYFSVIGEAHGISAGGVPTTFVGEEHFVGFNTAIANQIRATISDCVADGCEDISYPALISQGWESQDTQTDFLGEYNETPLCMHAFFQTECEPCERTFFHLEEVAERNNVNLYIYYMDNESDAELYERLKQAHGLRVGGFPAIFVGDTFHIGERAIVENVEKDVQRCLEEDCLCPVSQLHPQTSRMPQRGDIVSERVNVVNIPFLGDVNVGAMPLALMTILIAFVDGFNPCSLWVLTFLLGMVLFSGSRKKVLIIGITYLTVTATVYGLFMLAYLNVFLYIGYVTWIKIIVALLALTFGLINIKDYFWYKKGVSLSIPDKYKPKLFKQVRGILKGNVSVPAMIGATALMALGITLVELPCTAGFPMIWTNIILLHDLPFMEYMFLFLLYVLVYLSVELVIFFSAVFTMKSSALTEQRGRDLKLVGGIIMVVLAYVMAFRYDAMGTIEGTLAVFLVAFSLAGAVLIVHRKVIPYFRKR